ncbi:hypothetical protein [Pontibacter arcticus]|uniref:Lipoprotein n=1 Tax=Pontibacter arcticus TaxID=2080288 RepID=A0A364RAY7_9BACT|nr:hypothetical protein [Pontibacter arcticus]RAU81463.1 hypothetical protein DP923_15230 [Pontibacter arcticus]
MLKSILTFILALLLVACETKTETAAVQQPESPQADTTQAVTAPAPDSSFMIVPGVSMGQIRVGDTSEKVTATLGKPDSGDAAMGKALSVWVSKKQNAEPQHTVSVFFSRNGTEMPANLFARQIRINSPVFKTPEAIQTGSSLAAIRQHYRVAPFAYYLNKQQQRVYIFDDQAQGIAFEITTPDSTCTAITIHDKTKDITNSYIPLDLELIPVTN